MTIPIEGAHRNGLTVLPSILESHRPIDAVILMLGTNDLKGRFSLSATDIALALEKLVLVIRASLAGPNLTPPAVLLVAPPPILEIGPIGETLLGRRREIAAPRRAHRRYPPSGSACLSSTQGKLIEVSPIDGIHYDEAAQAILARAFAGAVQDHFC